MKYLLLALMLFILTYASAADAMRCKNKVVNRGDNQYRFLKLCGEPAFVRKKVVYISDAISVRQGDISRYHSHDKLQTKQGHQNTTHYQRKRQQNRSRHGHYEVEISHEHETAIEIEIWTYDFGSNRLVQEVKFVDGVAKHIRNRGYGT